MCIFVICIVYYYYCHYYFIIIIIIMCGGVLTKRKKLKSLYDVYVILYAVNSLPFFIISNDNLFVVCFCALRHVLLLLLCLSVCTGCENTTPL